MEEEQLEVSQLCRRWSWGRWWCIAARADLCNFCSPPAPVKLKKPLQTIIAAPLGSDLQSCSAHEVHSHSHSRIKRIFPVLITNTSGCESLFVAWWVMISPGLAACSLVSGGARERGSTGVLECAVQAWECEMVALSSDVRGHVWVSTLCLPDTWHPAGLAVYCQHYVNHSGTRNTLLLTQNKQLISPWKDYIWWGKNALKVSGWFNNINIEFSLHRKSLVQWLPSDD